MQNVGPHRTFKRNQKKKKLSPTDRPCLEKGIYGQANYFFFLALDGMIWTKHMLSVVDSIILYKNIGFDSKFHDFIPNVGQEFYIFPSTL